MSAVIDEWKRVSVPRLDASSLTVDAARSVLREINRVRAALDAAQAAAVSALRRTAGRDTRAALVRETGMSSADARQADRVAEVIEAMPDAAAALAEGAVSAGHLAALAPLAATPGAADLLACAAAESVDDFAQRVRRAQLEGDADGVAARQRSARTLSFFRAEDGGVGMRAVFTPIDGARVRAAIERACDAAWRADHPDRAPTLGGHVAEPRDRRLSDALVGIVCGAAGSSSRAEEHLGTTGTTGTVARPEGRGAADGSRIGVVVVIEETAMQAHIAGGNPISTADVVEVLHDARSEVYAAVRSASGSILSFGRSRRFATAIQKLALIARDGGTCVVPGCDVAWTRCDADHRIAWDRGGPTDLANLEHLCRHGHHTHRHDTGHPTGERPRAGPEPVP